MILLDVSCIVPVVGNVIFLFPTPACMFDCFGNHPRVYFCVFPDVGTGAARGRGEKLVAVYVMYSFFGAQVLRTRAHRQASITHASNLDNINAPCVEHGDRPIVDHPCHDADHPPPISPTRR